jgi:hypothetical protein
MFNVKIAPLDFSSFQWCQNAKKEDNTITPSELITHCPSSFRHIHCHKADCRDGLFMADGCRSENLKSVNCQQSLALEPIK